MMSKIIIIKTQIQDNSFYKSFGNDLLGKLDNPELSLIAFRLGNRNFDRF